MKSPFVWLDFEKFQMANNRSRTATHDVCDLPNITTPVQSRVLLHGAIEFAIYL